MLVLITLLTWDLSRVHHNKVRLLLVACGPIFLLDGAPSEIRRILLSFSILHPRSEIQILSTWPLRVTMS